MTVDTPSTPGTAEEHTITFAELGIDSRVLATLDEVGYENPTPIQAATIPVLLQGKDVVGLAQTGTGKTAAFAVPALSRLAELSDVNGDSPRHPGPGARPDPRARPPGRRGVLHLRHRTSRTSPCCRSTAAPPTARSSAACAAAPTSSSARPAA